MVTEENFAMGPAAYVESAILAREVGDQLLERLKFVKLQPKVVVDVGCGVGYCTALLKERYPKAQVIGLDLSHSMLQHACLSVAVCADGMMLPFANHSVDLVFANLVLPWCTDLERLLREWRRVLRPEGLLVFTSLGPDTLKEWQEVSIEMMMPRLLDMHVVGDMLTKVAYADPVLDLEYFTLTYREVSKLFYELQASGMWRELGALQSEHLKQVAEQSGKELAVTYEIVYGHAWGPMQADGHMADEEGIVRIPLASLRGHLGLR